jgi:hypothetical protein
MFNKEKKNYFIIIGCNYNGKLSGCINDAYSMYNTFSNIPNEEIYLLTDNKEKINKKIIENKIQSIHKKENKNSNSLYQIILTFSGHGEPNGILKLSENDLKCKELYEIINYGSNKKFELIVILDCCYSGGFTNLGKYGNIDKSTIITACNSSQQSAESITVNITVKNTKIKYDRNEKGDYYIGIFTFNFTKIINNLIEKEKEINTDNIFKDKIWNNIDVICKQSYQIKG